jgi:F420H(2)-dependent quinone reductase
MTSTIHRTLPPQRLITALNPVVRVGLRSPLHRWLDDSVLMLHVIGRRTGRRYDIPVGFVDLGDRLVVVTQHRWRGNLRGGGDVEVTRFGRRFRMHAELDEDPDPVADLVAEIVARLGVAGVKRRLGIVIEPGARPTHEDLSEAAREFDLAMITLTSLPEVAAP